MAIEDLLHPFLGNYLRMPEWVRASAGRLYSSLPQRVRLGRHYSVFREELKTAYDGAQAHRLALRKLEDTLRWAIATVPAYQKYQSLLVEGGEALEVLPFLPLIDKRDIKENPTHFCSAAMPIRARLATFTGGSTRNPMRFFLQKHVTRAKEYAFIQDFRERLGVKPRDRILAMRGRSVPAAVVQGPGAVMYEPIKRQLILSSDYLEERYMPAYVKALERHRPDFIEAFPSAIYPLARWLEAHPNPQVTDGVKGVMLYSENAYGFQMQMLRKVFRCPVLKHYGHSERVLMAASMCDDDRYFFWPQYGWFELLDRANRPITRPGEVGYVVGTSFDNRVMPFIRYRTGDMAMLGESAGSPLPGYAVCERIEGRLQEFLVCRDHRLISITTLGVAHFPELARVEAIQYEQREPGEIILKVVCAPALTTEERNRIAAAVENKTDQGCRVTLQQVDGIERTPRGKLRMLIQHLDLDAYFGASLQTGAGT